MQFMAAPDLHLEKKPACIRDVIRSCIWWAVATTTIAAKLRYIVLLTADCHDQDYERAVAIACQG